MPPSVTGPVKCNGTDTGPIKTIFRRRLLKKEYLLFDLDGTLTDPALGITNSLMYALKQYSITINDRTTLYKYIGPPLLDTFTKGFGFSDEQAAEAVVKYRDYFAVTGLYENTVYPEIPDMLSALQKAGKKLIVATSKPEKYSVRILKHFNLAHYFSCIAGSRIDESRSKKSEVIAYALERMQVLNRAKALMIGDRSYDITGAKECGLSSIGVLYGYGSREELETAGADYIATTVRELESTLLIM